MPIRGRVTQFGESKRKKTPMSTTTIRVSETRLKSGTPICVGVLDARTLTSLGKVPLRDSRSGTGYQRELSRNRVNKLVTDLKAGTVDLPTAVLLNLRGYDLNRHRDGDLLMLHSDDELILVDGQHREEALKFLVNEDGDRWGPFEIPFVCMLGADFDEELKQFHVVNSTAKSVRTDLSMDLLKQRAESDPALMGLLEQDGQIWKVKAQRLAEEMDKSSATWAGRIRFPGDPAGVSMIRSSGFNLSLKPLIGDSFFGALELTQQAEVLDAFWQGIGKVLPDVFAHPKEFVMQKSVGVQVMHSVALAAVNWVRQEGRSVKEPEAYADAMSDALVNLEGDTAGSGGVVRGSDFWQTGEMGAAGSHSSSAGKRVLIAKIKQGMPPMRIE